MTTYEIFKDKFLINGKLIYSEYPECPEQYRGLLMNARFIQGVFDEKSDRSRFDRFGEVFDPELNTEKLIEALPQWYAKGLRAFTVGFQGGGPCFTINNYTIENNPFSEDGCSMDEKYLHRMEKLITAADRNGMIVIVSFFYHAQVRFLENDVAVLNAVKTASNWLKEKQFTNVIIEIANEQNAPGFKVHSMLAMEEKVVKLMQVARRESGGMAVGCSLTGGVFSELLAQESDVILIHGNGQSRQKFYQLIKKAQNIRPVKPVVCNEDSQALSAMQVALEQEVSWGYYNNITKQEPPANWGITCGEDTFFALRMAEALGIEKNVLKPEEQFYLQGLEPHMEWEGKRWIRLASLYPEKIYKVEFYRDGIYYETAYNDPFTINFISNWRQGAVEDIKTGEVWLAKIYLLDGTVIEKEQVV